MVTRMLLKLARVKKPDYLAFAVDGPRKALLRRKLYPAYKAQRGKNAGELAPQLRRVREVVAALGVPVLAAPGYEADDIIATLVDGAKGSGLDVVIVGRDKDLMQLIYANTGADDPRPSVRCYCPFEERYWGPDDVKAKFGVRPGQLLDYLALLGDGVDNVPGVRGIGEKKAVALLTEWETGRNAYKFIKKLPIDVGILLSAGRADFRLSRKLVKLDRDVPLEFDTAALRHRGLDLEGAKPLFATLGFKRWE